jgi:hypothetical protein
MARLKVLAGFSQHVNAREIDKISGIQENRRSMCDLVIELVA